MNKEKLLEEFDKKSIELYKIFEDAAKIAIDEFIKSDEYQKIISENYNDCLDLKHVDEEEIDDIVDRLNELTSEEILDLLQDVYESTTTAYTDMVLGDNEENYFDGYIRESIDEIVSDAFNDMISLD